VPGAKVFERNSYDDVVYWSGVLDLPELVEEVLADDVLFVEDPREFETYLGEWWDSFISDFYV
jgi:esterase/lipase superfamily enzyme